MNYRQLLREREADAMVRSRPVAFSLGRFPLKDRFQLSCRYVDGTVCYGDREISRRHTGAYLDGSGGGTEFYDVRHQVDQDGLHLRRIEGHHERFNRNLDVDIKLLLTGERMEARCCRSNE